MENFQTTEALLAWIVDFFAVNFGAHAILKGGMALRLLQSPRYTNNADFVFVPYSSKKDALELIHTKLSQVKGLTFTSTMNSKALCLKITYANQTAQVKINVHKECASIPVSTTLLSSVHGLTPRLIRIMDLPTAFAHKLAAWNERHLLRDLYDIYAFSTVMKVSPNRSILSERLAHVHVDPKTKPAKNLVQFKAQLVEEADRLTEKYIHELSALLPHAEMAGLVMRMQFAVRNLVEMN